MKILLIDYARDDRGGTLVEYAIIIFILSIALYAAFLSLGKNISTTGTDAAIPISSGNSLLK
jgi:Flp pilus assembly pilin Flp